MKFYFFCKESRGNAAHSITNLLDLTDVEIIRRLVLTTRKTASAGTDHGVELDDDDQGVSFDLSLRRGHYATK